MWNGGRSASPPVFTLDPDGGEACSGKGQLASRWDRGGSTLGDSEAFGRHFQKIHTYTHYVHPVLKTENSWGGCPWS